MTDNAQIEADIADAKARYREAFNVEQFELARDIQKQINILYERLAAIERKVFIF